MPYSTPSKPLFSRSSSSPSVAPPRCARPKAQVANLIFFPSLIAYIPSISKSWSRLYLQNIPRAWPLLPASTATTILVQAITLTHLLPRLLASTLAPLHLLSSNQPEQSPPVLSVWAIRWLNSPSSPSWKLGYHLRLFFPSLPPAFSPNSQAPRSRHTGLLADPHISLVLCLQTLVLTEFSLPWLTPTMCTPLARSHP